MRIKSPVFVGRREELDLLSGWLREAREGTPRVVVIGGEAGIGKSRLLDEFSRIAAQEGTRWLIGAAADYGAGGLPFGPVVEALRPVVSSRADAPLAAALGPARQELSRLLPDLSIRATKAEPGLAAGSVAVGLDPLPQLRLFELLLGLLDLIARDQPAVLVLEDLHWADMSTREFLSFVARNLGTTPLLVVGTYRSDDLRRSHPLRRYLTELQRAGRIEHIELRRFGRLELHDQLRAIRGTELDETLLDELHARSQGNPFFAEELLAAGAYMSSPGPLPPSLRHILLARADRLGPAGRDLLSAAAVLGVADERMLGPVAGLPEDALLVLLREAIDNSILELRGRPGESGYGFRHALLREAIYGDLLKGERVRLHQRVAESLSASIQPGEEADARRLALLAHHWHQAERPVEAFVAAWRAATAAERAHAYPEARLHFERALEQWQEVEAPEQVLRRELDAVGEEGAPGDYGYVAERAAMAADVAGDLSRAVELWHVAADEVDEADYPDRAAQIQVELMGATLDSGDALAAAVARDRAIALLARSSSPVFRAEVLIRASHHLLVAEDRALPLALEALAAADESGRPDLRAWAHIQVARHSSFLGDVDAGMAHFEAARGLAQQTGQGWTLAGLNKERATVLECSARFEEALEALEASRAGHRRLGAERFAKHTDALVAQTLHRLGRWAEAEAAVERALTPPATVWAYVVKAYLLVGVGRFDEAARALEMAWESVEHSNSSASFGPYYAALAEMAIWQQRPADAVDAALEAFTQAMDDRWFCELSALGIRAAADLPAEVGLERGQALFRDFEARARQATKSGSIFEPEIRAWLSTGQAEMSRLRNESDVSLWANAAAGWRTLSERYPEAYALYRHAEALLIDGDRRAAAASLRRSFELCRQMGAAPLRGEVESLARRARLDLGSEAAPRGTASADDYGLTTREREVLALLALGHSDQQIADELFISPKTASVHVSNVKGKLGVEHRIEAAAVGLRLLDAPPHNG